MLAGWDLHTAILFVENLPDAEGEYDYDLSKDALLAREKSKDALVKHGRRRGKKYVKFDDLIEYLKALRMNRSINDSPYMDNALLNIQQLLELYVYNSIIFDYIEIGGCEDCLWRNRHQKCSCCRRNRRLKDCYREREDTP